ncbi:MAG: hypothetical protein RL264_852 [Bacteroidota bacterium]|jgi:uncharacterized YigZ family protein
MFKTIESTSEGDYREKGSKFFAFAFPVQTEEEIKEHISQLRKRNPGAVHVCSAFRLGAEKKLYRSSDDGEPSNSAGPPILGQIQSFDLTNVMIAVVRYYGGINLGVGGLINAYRTASKLALENAKIIETEDATNLRFSFSYESTPNIMSLLKKMEIQIQSFQQDWQCEISCLIPASKQFIINDLKELGCKLEF